MNAWSRKGHKICFMAEYYLPDTSRTPVLSCAYKTRILKTGRFWGAVSAGMEQRTLQRAQAFGYTWSRCIWWRHAGWLCNVRLFSFPFSGTVMAGSAADWQEISGKRIWKTGGAFASWQIAYRVSERTVYLSVYENNPMQSSFINRLVSGLTGNTIARGNISWSIIFERCRASQRSICAESS